MHDALVVGSGPNGLAAAITLARAGKKVLVLEGAETVGGGLRSAELTLPGFVHDVCSAIHPLGVGSPFFRSLPLEKHGLSWVEPEFPAAHPLADGSAAILKRSVDDTAEQFGEDAEAYRKLMGPLADKWEKLAPDLLRPFGLPGHPLAMARFGLNGLRSAKDLAHKYFSAQKAKALFAGMAAHSILPLDRRGSAAIGLVLAMTGHAVGWSFPVGGAQSFADALVDYLSSLGGEVSLLSPVRSLEDLPPVKAVLLNISPRQFLEIGGEQLPQKYRESLGRYRYGPGVFKVDWALDGPVPWKAKDCANAGTVHLGGTFEEIAAGETAVWEGKHPDRPFVLLAQHTLFDKSRAPAGKHTVWAYCHVPHGSSVDMTAQIERQIERFAPGFRERILSRHTMTATAFEQYNPNYVGGDINGGVQDLGQLFARPVRPLNPYATPLKNVFLCSSSTPPGGGVHGMCGYHAARLALKNAL